MGKKRNIPGRRDSFLAHENAWPVTSSVIERSVRRAYRDSALVIGCGGRLRDERVFGGRARAYKRKKSAGLATDALNTCFKPLVRLAFILTGSLLGWRAYRKRSVGLRDV